MNPVLRVFSVERSRPPEYSATRSSDQQPGADLCEGNRSPAVGRRIRQPERPDLPQFSGLLPVAVGLAKLHTPRLLAIVESGDNPNRAAISPRDHRSQAASRSTLATAWKARHYLEPAC